MSFFQLNQTTFILPSMGLAYDLEKVPLLGGDSVKMRPFVAGDLRTFKSGNDAYRLYFNLLSKIVVETKLSFDELLLSDVLAILFAARIVSFGPEYGITYACDNCNSRERAEIDLSTIEVKYANEFDFMPSDIPITLGKGIEVTAHLPRLKDEKQLNMQLQSMKRSGTVVDEDIDRSYLRIAMLLDSINGEEEKSIMKKFEFVNNLPIQALNIFNEKLNECDSGIIPKFFDTCKACGWENELALGMGAEFFRPAKS
jgi:hypothetical protein